METGNCRPLQMLLTSRVSVETRRVDGSLSTTKTRKRLGREMEKTRNDESLVRKGQFLGGQDVGDLRVRLRSFALTISCRSKGPGGSGITRGTTGTQQLGHLSPTVDCHFPSPNTGH